MLTKRRLLILDLDETLVYVREGRATGECDFTFPGHHAVRRPHVDSFLEFAFRRFEIAVWSAATADDVDHRGWALSDVLAIDDRTESYRRNYGNLVRVAPFEGDPADRQLLELVDILERRAQRPDVRGPD